VISADVLRERKCSPVFALLPTYRKCIGKCTAFHWAKQPLRTFPSRGDLDSQLIYGLLGAPDTPPQSEYRSSETFLRDGYTVVQTDGQTDRQTAIDRYHQQPLL